MADLEKLVLSIEARTAQFDKALKRMEKNTATFANNSSRSVKRFGKQMDRMDSKMKGIGRRAGGYLKAGLFAKLAGEITGSFDDVFASIDRIGKTADKIGLTTAALQELQFASSQSGVELRANDLALQRFSRRAAEAADGSGALYKVFKANGVALRDQQGQIRPLIDLLNDYADIIKSAKTAQDQLRLAFIAFDSEGAAMVNTMRDGSSGLSTLREEARKTGAVLGDDLVRDAERITDQFDRLSQTIGGQFKRAVVGVASEISYLLGQFTALENRSLAAIQRDIAKVKATKESFNSGSLGGSVGDFVNGRYDNNIARLESQQRQLLAARKNQGFDFNAFLKGESKPDREFKGFGANNNKKKAAKGSKKPRGSSRRDDAAKAAERQAEQVLKVVQSLEQEAAQLGRTASEQELYNALTRAGVTLESEHGQAIRDAVGALQVKREAVKALEEAEKMLQQQTQAVTDAFEFFGEGALDVFEDIITGSDSAEDSLKRLALSISRAAAEAALFGRGPLAGLFGSIGGNTSGGGILGSLASSLIGSFTGGATGAPVNLLPRANGGSVLPGQSYLVGERGYEQFIPSHAGRIEPNRSLASNDNSKGGAVVTIHMNVNTPDVQSFKRSEGQIATDLARAVSRGQRGL